MGDKKERPKVQNTAGLGLLPPPPSKASAGLIPISQPAQSNGKPFHKYFC